MEYLVNGAEEIFSLQGEKYNQILILCKSKLQMYFRKSRDQI